MKTFHTPPAGADTCAPSSLDAADSAKSRAGWRFFFDGPVISRDAAKAAGLKHYFTGRPCKRGHVNKRFVSTWTCFTCWNMHRVARLAASDPDEIRRYYREYAQANREKVRAHGKKSYWRHKRKNNERCRIWLANNLEKLRLQKRKYRAKNPNLSVVSNHSRRARVIAGGGDGFTRQQLLILLNLQKGRCANCAGDIRRKWDADHVVPLFLGGPHEIGNIQLMCPTCNRRKSKKHPIEFAQMQGRLL